MEILGYKLDKEQMQIVRNDSRYLLVIAGAGAGKTLTILGKIKYLVENKNIKPDQILCISYTNLATNNLNIKIKNILNIDIDCLTFHKLALKISKNDLNIIDDNYLDEIIYDFFYNKILFSKKHMQMVLFYFHKFSFYHIKEKYIDFYSKNYKQIKLLSREIKAFICLFKANGYDLKYFLDLKKKCLFKSKKIFLLLCLNIYLMYQNSLDKNYLIDFDDLITNATNIYKKNLKYKYIIIDEYQDISLIRFKLINKIVKENKANLMAVGDDYQSIYRFSGSSISFFLNFKKIYPDADILYIKNTYRNSSELIYIASKFILKNKKQLKKELHSNKHILKPIKIIYYTKKSEILSKVFDYINKKYQSDILVLGRNKNDINLYLNNNIKLLDKKIIYNNYKYNYLTVHASKGLEEENVLLINLDNDILGFPNQIKNIKFFNELINVDEKYKYAEERRLFYVALTRTRNNIFILINKNKMSIFADEIITNFFKYIEFIKL